MIKSQQIIAGILLFIISISNLATPVAYAAELGKFHVKQPGVDTQNRATLASNIQLPQPDTGSVLGASTSLLTTETVPLDSNGDNEDSANTRIAPRMETLAKKVYGTNEDVQVSVINPDNEPFTTNVTDGKGDRVSVPITESNDGTITTVDISSSDSIRPGRYTLAVKDSQGQMTKQDFTWGVLAMNFDKSEYHPGETGDISFAVLNDNGDMVCDAKIILQITNQGGGTDTLSTANVISPKSQITVNPQCQSHDYSLQPDYEAHYTFGKPGIYAMSVTATTMGISHTVSDSIQVTNQIPFAVQRVSATRIYPPNTYPVLFNITANRDFTGTVTETVPDSFTITPATQSAVQETGQTGSVSSYDNMQTVYLNNNDPAANLQQAIIASDSGGLVMPFIGDYPITQGFGAQMTDPALQSFYTSFGLAGHDGDDFGVPMDTPLYAVDTGTVIWSGPGDYGITIIIQHGWGESYYGHLSSTIATVGQSVSKGELIGYSGESGDATGPHLHFGMRPDNPDMTNGYYGKIDPLPYLPFGHEPEPTSALNQTTLATAGQQLLAATGVLGASDDASAQPEDTQTPAPSILPTLLPTIEPVLSLTPPATPSGVPSISPTEIPGPTATPTPQPSSEETQQATPAADESFSVLEKQIQLNEALTASTQTEKVKVISWQVHLKKGQKITLGYAFQAPRVSPEFYLLGPVKFYANGSNKIIYQEQRQWEIASDDVGVEWYSNNTVHFWNGYSWRYRKKIAINASDVSTASVSSPNVTNDQTAVTEGAGLNTDLTWSQTVSSSCSNALLIVGTSTDSAGNTNSNVTYNGVSMTKLATKAGTASEVELWYMLDTNLTTIGKGTSQTIDVSFPAGSRDEVGGSASFCNVAQTGTFGAETPTSGATSPITESVTTTNTNQAVFAVSSAQGGGTGVTANHTALWNNVVSAEGFGQYTAGTNGTTTMSWTYTGSLTWDEIAVPINPSTPPVDFIDAGGAATNTNGGSNILTSSGGFYNGDSGSPTVDCTVAENGPCSYKFNATVSGTEEAVSENSILADSGRRISMYVNYATLPNSGGTGKDALIAVFTNNDATFISDLVNVMSTGKLCINSTSGAACGNDAMSPNTWYRISVSYTCTSTSVNSASVYLNGTLEASETNQTWGANCGSQALAFGTLDSGTASTDNVLLHIEDIYVDSGTNNTDPGNVHVTAKLPIANGDTDTYGTQSGTPTGDTTCSDGTTNCEYVNERPLDATEYLQGAQNTTEHFQLQGTAVGDVNISNDNYIADESWIYAEETSSGCTGSTLMNNGTATSVTLSTSFAMYTNLTNSGSYPGSNQGVGLASCTNSDSARLAEAGMQVAYIAPPNGSQTNFPVLINLTSDPGLSAHAQNNGNDILFTDSTGETLLPYEIESYSAGTLVAWVQISSLSSTSNPIIYMYYGNPAATSQAVPTSVWDTNYKGVWHFGEGSGTTSHDSTANAQTGTLNSSPSWVSGQMGKALQYNGANSDTATLGGDPGTTNTIESWEYPTTSVSTGTLTIGHDADSLGSLLSSSWSHTTTSSQSNLIIIVGVYSTGNPTGVTYGGQALTEIINGTSPGGVVISLWYRVNPLTGTNTVAVTGGGTVGIGGSSTYYNVSQTSPIGNSNSNSSAVNSSSATVTVSSTNTTQKLVDLGTVNNSSGCQTPGSGQTQTWCGSVGDMYGSDKTGTSATTTMSWTLSNSTTWLLMAAALNPAISNPSILTHITDPSLVPSYGGCTASASALPLNTWTDLSVVSNGAGSCSMYQNGNLTETGTTGVDFGTSLNIGESSFIGTIDEVRVSNTARTPGWITTEYNNENSPGTFYTVETTPETDIYAPTLSQLMRHGEFFGTQGVESGIRQPFTW